MSEFEYWCTDGLHWVDDVRLNEHERPSCLECWQYPPLPKGYDPATVTDQVWEAMQPVARVKTELHPSFSFWEE